MAVACQFLQNSLFESCTHYCTNYNEMCVISPCCEYQLECYGQMLLWNVRSIDIKI